MGTVIAISLVIVICVLVGLIFFCCADGAKGNYAVGIFVCVVAIGLYIGMVIYWAPERFGVGYVPTNAENFTKRLVDGQTYQIIALDKDGSEQILFVKRLGTSDYRTVRVKTEIPIPKYFVLVNGNPVAVTPAQ